MENHLAILKKVGLVLLVVGLLDIAFMIYCVTNDLNYSSSLNIFAVLAGIFLMRASLLAVRLVTWFLTFVLTGFIGAILFIFPFSQPVGLVVTQFRLNPFTSVGLCLFALAILVLLTWVYGQLRSVSVLAALESKGHSTSVPKVAIACGVALVAFLGVILHSVLNGELADKAVALAEKQLGPGYHYSTQSIQWSGQYGRAMVVAYNDQEIRYVSVEW